MINGEKSHAICAIVGGAGTILAWMPSVVRVHG